MDVESLAKQLILKGMTEEQQQAVLQSIKATMSQSRELQKQRVGEQARLVIEALKKIEVDIKSRYDEVGNKIEQRVASIKDGQDGRDGADGRPGKDGRDGSVGPRGPAGRDGVDGRDGEDGVSVTDARIDFDGSLVISLSTGREINVGEVVAPDLAEKIKVITNGGGTSQTVLDTLASLQTQINNLIPSQTGNAGKYLTTNGSVLSWASVAGGLSYQGTWNASTNTPTLASGVGTNGYYYIVATAGSTNLDGITDWQIGDWLMFNGTVWQKIDQSNLVTSVNGQTGAVSLTTTNINEGTNLYYTDARARGAISAGTGISYNSSTGVVTNAGVTSFNTRTGGVTLGSSDVTTALGYTPVNKAGDTITGPTVVSANSASDALRITQTGAGNALVVEDAANPDATPFLVDASGIVVSGYTTSVVTAGSATAPRIQVHGLGSGPSSTGITSWATGGDVGPRFVLSRSEGGTVGTQTIVDSGDQLGLMIFAGSDGTNFIEAARIQANVDGTPGTNDMPGRLVFSTTADGASTPTERVRITSQGNTGFHTTKPAAPVHVGGNAIVSSVDVQVATYEGLSFSVAGQELTPHGIFFSPDGYRMFVTGIAGDDVNQYNLSTPWDVSSATYSTVFSVSGQDTAPQGLFFRADGLKMYVLGANTDTVYQYALTAPWSVSTAAYESISFSVAAEDTAPTGLFFKPDGSMMYMVGQTNDIVRQYVVSTPWDVSTASYLQGFSVTGQESLPTDLSFTLDGTRMFVSGNTGDDISVYDLTTPWDVTTATFLSSFSVATQDTIPAGLYVKPDGTRMYVVGQNTDTVYQYVVDSTRTELTGPTSANGNLTVQQNLAVYGRAGFGTNTPQVSLAISASDAMLIPKGATGDRPAGAAGYLRFNTTTSEFEGYNGAAWASVGGAAISNDTSTATNVYPLFASSTTGTALTVYTSNAKLLYKPSTGELSVSAPRASNGIVVNSQTISADYTIASGDNGGSFGPVSVASGITVTVSSGSTWTVV